MKTTAAATALAAVVLARAVCAAEDAPGELRISIADATRLGLQNNFDIQVFRLDRSISEEELLKAESVYDSALSLSLEYDKDRLKKSSVILGKETTTITEEATLSKKLLQGTTLSLGASHSRDASDSTFVTVNPIHETRTGISVTQPLWKDRWGILGRNNVEITKLGIESSGYTSADRIEGELAGVQKSYWNLLLALKEAALAGEILESARELYEANRKNFDLGVLEAPEFYATEANLKEKEQETLVASDRLNTALNLMRFKLNLGTDTSIVPEDEFALDGKDETYEGLVRAALANRRDYERAKNSVEEMALLLEMKENSLWPQVDLVASFTRNGLNDEFSDSLSAVTSEDYPEYAVGITFSMPLENRAARAEHSQQEMEKAKALVSLKRTECLILVQVHDAFVHVKSARSSAGLLEKAMELQQKKYLEEGKRFRTGRSDTDRYIRYQNDYLRAKLLHLRSLYMYKEALIDLKVALNILLKEAETLL